MGLGLNSGYPPFDKYNEMYWELQLEATRLTLPSLVKTFEDSYRSIVATYNAIGMAGASFEYNDRISPGSTDRLGQELIKMVQAAGVIPGSTIERIAEKWSFNIKAGRFEIAGANSQISSGISEDQGSKNAAIIELSIPARFGKKYVQKISGVDDNSIITFNKDSLSLGATKQVRISLAKNTKEVGVQAKTFDKGIIYNQSTGELFYNENGPAKGFGSKGGLFATLLGTPTLSENSFSFSLG